ncbi:MAG: PLP-dependent aminotransferase family protein, partial [Mesorhizobium sp.]
MTLWQPDPALIRRPAYLSLADQFARAIHDGKLANGARLPTHRRLAGEVGRGSFVQTQRREPEPPYLPERLGEVIDLSILKPVCEPMHLEKLKQALGWLAENLPSSSALSFRPNMVF